MNALWHWLIAGVSSTTVTAAGGAVFGFYKYLTERRKDRAQRKSELEQRREEFTWRQSQTAKELVDEMLEDELANAAFEMLDSWSREFEYKDGATKVIAYEEWSAALHEAGEHPERVLDVAGEDVAMFVRDAFDALFYYMAMLEHYLQRRFVNYEDIRFPLSYYIRIMAEDRAVYEHYVQAFHLERVLELLARFPEWTEVRRGSGGIGPDVVTYPLTPTTVHPQA